MNDSLSLLKRAAVLLAAIACPLTASLTENFGDLSLPAGSRWNGSDESGQFQSGSAVFYNSYGPTPGYWYGFAYSTRIDTSPTGMAGQFTSATGGGMGPGGVYAIGFQDPYAEQSGAPSCILELTLTQGQSLEGIYVTNTLWTYTSMRDGDTYAKKFGGADGTDPDWFKMTIHGFDANMESTGEVEVYLADFRFADDSLDYILSDWLFADLSSLADATQFLSFSFDSSDTGDWGMNTPAYFAMGGLQFSDIPEPATLAWVLPFALFLSARRRARGAKNSNAP